MNGFTESGITLDFPTNKWFRFEKTDFYRTISGNHFKEIDACWLDVDNNIFYLIELKDYTSTNISEQVEMRINNLWKKSVNSLQMINSALLKTTKGSTLTNEIGFEIQSHYTYKYLAIIKIDPDQKTYLSFMKDKYKNLFKSYATLFGITNYSLISYDAALNLFPQFVK